MEITAVTATAIRKATSPVTIRITTTVRRMKTANATIIRTAHMATVPRMVTTIAAKAMPVSRTVTAITAITIITAMATAADITVAAMAKAATVMETAIATAGITMAVATVLRNAKTVIRHVPAV